MKTIEIQLYKFNELSKESKEKALKNYSNINENMDYDYIIYEAVRELTTAGFLNAKIEYSGFWSQGDGLCFDATIDVSKFAETSNEKRIAKLIFDGSIEEFTIEKTSFANHYSHEKTRYIDHSKTGRENIDKVMETLENKIESIRLQFCNKFYNTLEDAYDYDNSEEAIIETFDMNDYDFTENGKIY